MKTFFCVLLILAVFFAASYAEHDKSIIYDLKIVYDLKIKITGISPSGIINVETNNSSKVPIKVWRESNSWGASRWRVNVIRKENIEAFFQNPNMEFSKNGPVFDEIAAGAHTIRKLDLNGGNWCGLRRCTLFDERRSGKEQIHFEAGDEIIVSYDVPFTYEAWNMGVWYGVASTLMTVK